MDHVEHGDDLRAQVFEDALAAGGLVAQLVAQVLLGLVGALKGGAGALKLFKADDVAFGTCSFGDGLGDRLAGGGHCGSGDAGGGLKLLAKLVALQARLDELLAAERP